MTEKNVLLVVVCLCIVDIVGHSVCDVASASSDGLEDLCATICLRVCCILRHVDMLCVDIRLCYEAEQVLDKVGTHALHL